MKKITLCLLLLAVTLSINSQTLIESDSYGIDQYIEKCSDIPVLRQINGGTVFNITFEPEEEWNNAMKGHSNMRVKYGKSSCPTLYPSTYLQK